MKIFLFTRYCISLILEWGSIYTTPFYFISDWGSVNTTTLRIVMQWFYLLLFAPTVQQCSSLND